MFEELLLRLENLGRTRRDRHLNGAVAALGAQIDCGKVVLQIQVFQVGVPPRDPCEIQRYRFAQNCSVK
ncbi:hypothetical protein D3C72_2149120 [compost metagenome]